MQMTSSDSRPVVFTGMCDASGAVPIDDHHFLVANDEDNVLRIYDAKKGGPPTQTLDLTSALSRPEVMPRRSKRKASLAPAKLRAPKEADIEAATRLGEHACFLASHSKAGGVRTARERFVFFCTTLPTDQEPLELVGIPYRSLFEDFVASPLLSRIDWVSAAQQRPPHEAAVNIEAMTASPEGGLWIGLRSPLQDHHAIFVLIGNPEELPRGGRSRIERVAFVDLGGLGARGMTYAHHEYVILAGPASQGKTQRLYRWRPGDAPVERGTEWFADFNPEGFFNPTRSTKLMLLSDDGDRLIDGSECKKQSLAEMRHFRGLWRDIGTI